MAQHPARKVLLLFSEFGRNPVFFDIMEPLALEILSAIATEEGCDPLLIDLRMDRSALERLVKSGYEPDLIAVTGRAYFEIPALNRLIAKCKALWPNAPLVLGGGQATITPELYAQQYVDILVMGPGERLWRTMCREGVTRHSPTLIMQDAESSGTYSFPIPDRKSLAKYRKKYVSYWPHHDGKSPLKPWACMVTSQGCPFRCTFCAVWPANLGRYRRRPIPEIVEELRSIEEHSVYFFDDNTLGSLSYATELADAIDAAGIHKEYLIYSRADDIVSHPDLIQKWASIGMHYVVLGVEVTSADDKLGEINKQTTMQQNEQALRILAEAGVHCHAHILLTPEMTHADFDQMYDFVAEHGLEYPIAPFLTPLPGTALFDDVKSKGQLLTENPEFYTFNYMVIRPTNLSIRQYYREADRLYRRVWSWRRYLSGQCGDVTLLGFIEWWAFMRLFVFYFRLSRRAFFREIEAADENRAPAKTANTQWAVRQKRPQTLGQPPSEDADVPAAPDRTSQGAGTRARP